MPVLTQYPTSKNHATPARGGVCNGDSNYKGLMNNYWMPHLAALPMRAVTPMVLRPANHFNQAVEALGIPRRPQYNCRHTYATMCLMSGMNPAFIASQLGHSVQVLLSTYAKWLNSASDWSELDKLEMRLIGTELVQD